MTLDLESEDMSSNTDCLISSTCLGKVYSGDFFNFIYKIKFGISLFSIYSAIIYWSLAMCH